MRGRASRAASTRGSVPSSEPPDKYVPLSVERTTMQSSLALGRGRTSLTSRDTSTSLCRDGCGNHDQESRIEVARLHRRQARSRRNSTERRGGPPEDGTTARPHRNVRSEHAIVWRKSLRAHCRSSRAGKEAHRTSKRNGYVDRCGPGGRASGVAAVFSLQRRGLGCPRDQAEDDTDDLVRVTTHQARHQPIRPSPARAPLIAARY